MEFGIGFECFEEFGDDGGEEDIHELMIFLGVLELSKVEEVFCGIWEEEK